MKLNRWLRPLALASLLTFGTAASAADELQTVSFVDVAQYLGKWYEIARLPQIFETGCTGVTADYSLNDDGSVKVLNTCHLLTPDGVPITVTAKAVPIDETNSKLDVTFFNSMSSKGKYWILELDPNYQWALVGDPARSSLFFLSRTPTLDETIYQDLLSKAATRHGYENTDQVTKTEQ